MESSNGVIVMAKWMTLLSAILLSVGCTSYKKAVTRHAVIDDKIERDKLISGREESNVDTSVWQNKKIVITDVEFYRGGEGVGMVVRPDWEFYRHNDDGSQVKVGLPTPRNLYAAAPVKRLRRVVIESLQEEQAISRAVTSGEAIEVNRVEINEQEDIKEDKRPVAGLISVYIFGLGVFSGLLILMFLRKLFTK